MDRRALFAAGVGGSSALTGTLMGLLGREAHAQAAPLARRADAARFTSWEDVNRAEVRVGFNLGTTMEQFVTAELPRVTVRRVESPVRDFQELLAGRVDVTITSLVEGSQLQREYAQL